MPSRRIKAIQVSYELITEVLKGRLKNGETNLPIDAEIVAIGDSALQVVARLLIVYISSDTFPELIEGQPIPVFQLIIKNDLS